jgi:pimeloyl-ACP methyl ester carboxylesterase
LLRGKLSQLAGRSGTSKLDIVARDARLGGDRSALRAGLFSLVMLASLAFACGGGRSASRAETAAPPADPPAPLDADLASLPGARAVWMADPEFGGMVYVILVDPPGGVWGPPLVLVHGLGTVGARDFYSVMPALARGRRLIALDLPGFAHSGRANERYTPERYAAVVAAAIQRFAGGRADVLGHSMGGAIALMHAGTYPSQVRRLVLVDAAGILHKEAWFGHHLRRMTDPASLVFPAGVDELNQITATVFSKTRILDIVPDVVLVTPALRKKVLSGNPGRIAALGLILTDFSHAIAGVTAPTLIVWGGNDMVAAVRTGDLLAERLGASHVVLEGVGHNVMAEAGAALVGAVTPFLTATDTPAPPPVAPAAVSLGNTRCEGKKDLTLTGTFDDVVIEKCERVTLDHVSARRLIIRDGSARVLRSKITSGVNVERADLVVTGGYVGGAVPLELKDAEVDLAGTTLDAGQNVYRLNGTSRVIFSVCPVGAGARHLHGVIEARDELVEGGAP